MRYKAFLSYKHGDDDALATSLEKALEKFAKPTFKRRALEIFRDSNDLSVAADLGEKIRNGLETSEYIICMASPKYAQSKWCCREAEFWRDNKPIENFFIVLTDGEILWDETTNDFDWSVSTAIPKALSGVFTGEPFYIDFRNCGPEEQLNLDNPDFKTRLVLLAATLHGKSVGDMVGEAVRQHKRTLWLRNSAIAIVMALMSLTIVLTMISNRRKSASLLHFQAKAMEQTNPTLALRLEEEALNIYDYPDFKQSAFELINRNTFYKILTVADSTYYTDMDISTKDGTIVLSNADGTVSLMDQEGVTMKQFNTGARKVNAVQFSPDGNTILTGTDTGAQLWNLEGSLITEFKLDNSAELSYRVLAIAFAPDGQSILTGSSRGAHIWNLNGTRISDFEINHEVKAVAFAPDGNAVLIGYDGAKLAAELFDLQGNSMAIFSTDDANFGEPYTITNSVAFSEDGQTVLICSNVNGIQLFNPEGEKIEGFNLSSLTNFEEGSWKATISPDGTKILMSSFENNGQLINRKGELMMEFKGHEDHINIVAFDPSDDNTVFTGSFDKTIRKWYSEGLYARVQNEFNIENKPIQSIDLSPDGESLLISSGDSLATLWDFKGQSLNRFNHEGIIKNTIFSPDGKQILSYSNHVVKIWDLDGNQLGTTESTDEMINSIAFTPNGKMVLISYKSNIKPEGYLPWYLTAFHQWDWNSNSIKELEIDVKEAISASFAPDGKMVLTNTDGESYLLDLDGQVIQEFNDSNKLGNWVSIAPTGNLILTNNYDDNKSPFKTTYGKSRLFNFEGKLLQEFKLNTESVDPVGFTENGLSIITLCYPELNPWDKGNPTARLWDLKGNVQLKIHSPGKYITDIAISSNGNYIVAGYQNNWSSAMSSPQENKVVIYKTIELEEFLKAYVAPLSEEQRKEFDVD